MERIGLTLRFVVGAWIRAGGEVGIGEVGVGGSGPVLRRVAGRTRFSSGIDVL